MDNKADLRIALLRTLTPIFVGTLLTLALKAGISIDEGSLTMIVQAFLSAGYYAIALQLEKVSKRFPWLGSRKTPTYNK